MPAKHVVGVEGRLRSRVDFHVHTNPNSIIIIDQLHMYKKLCMNIFNCDYESYIVKPP